MSRGTGLVRRTVDITSWAADYGSMGPNTTKDFRWSEEGPAQNRR